jgi:hypothetical protein
VHPQVRFHQFPMKFPGSRSTYGTE